jgi:hypothetical protein
MLDRKSFRSPAGFCTQAHALVQHIRSGSIAGDSGDENSDIDVGLERARYRSEADSAGDGESEEDWGDQNPIPRRLQSRESDDSMPAEVPAPFRRRRRVVSASSEDEQE